MRRIAPFLLVLPVLGCGSNGGGSPAPVTQPSVAPPTVKIADAALEGCVRDAIGKSDGDLVPDDLAGLTALACQDRKIASLAGLEAATALTSLTLWENQIADVGPLAKLTALTDLTLGYNQISDISPLASLTQLTRLDLAQNQIADLSALDALTALAWLNLDHNAFGADQLAHVAGLSKLTWLTIEHNALGGAALPKLAAGGEVYGAFTNAAKAPPAGGAGAGRVALTGLQVRTDASGATRLHVRSSRGLLPVRHEFGGALRVAKGEILWDAPDGRTIAVGRADAGGEADLCQGAYASVCTAAIGQKTGTAAPGAGAEPVVTMNLSIGRTALPHGGPGTFVVESDETGGAYHALESLALASPNQLDGDTCLYMSSTGAMEILLDQHAQGPFKSGGDTDLSERWLVNASTLAPTSAIPYFITDTLYTYNVFGGSMLDRDYPFVADYMTQDANGNWIPAASTDSGAQLSCMANWTDALPKDWKSKLVPTPKIERTTVFIDPLHDKNSIWNVGIMSDETIERIKHTLRTKNAPVLVTYNHYLFWHQVIIVGYDDNETSDGCAMVDDSVKYYQQKGSTSYVDKVNASKAKNGGCSTKGVFYVRDSIYDGGADEGTYDYGNGFTKKYSKRIIKHSYMWPKYLGNHSFAMHRQ